MVSMNFFVKDRISYDLQRGPFKSSEEWLDMCFLAEEKDCESRFKAAEDEEDMELANRMAANLRRLGMLRHSLFQPRTDDGPEMTALCHHDLSEQNILVDENGDLSGIVDWECMSVLPLWKYCELPAFLRGPERRKRPQKECNMPSANQDDGDEAREDEEAAKDLEEMLKDARDAVKVPEEAARDVEKVARVAGDVAKDAGAAAQAAEEVAKDPEEVAKDTGDTFNDPGEVAEGPREVARDTWEVANDTRDAAQETEEVARDVEDAVENTDDAEDTAAEQVRKDAGCTPDTEASDDIYWDNLEDYEKTLLRDVFAEEIRRIDPELAEIYLSPSNQRKADAESALSVCGDDTDMGDVRRWLDRVELGEEVRMMEITWPPDSPA